MSREVIREFGGKIVGYIDTQPNGDKIVRAFSGVILGKYDCYCNVTRDFSGKILYQGDQAVSLIGMNKDK